MDLEEGKYKMILEHAEVLESKEVFKSKRMGTCQRDTEANPKKHPMAQTETI